MLNPLLAEWLAPYDFPPFDAISDDDFAPAFEAALAEARANIAAIADNPDAPTFANTIDAYEQAEHALEKVLSVFYTLAGAHSNPAREALQRDFAPKLSAYSSEVSSNKALFARIDALWQDREALGITAEQQRVLYLTHRGFVRAGAKLEGAAADRLTQVKGRLATLGTQFSQNLLADERDWQMVLGADDMEGLPDFLIAAATSAGEERGADGPVITLSRSLIVPFLQFSPRRDLREIAFKAWAARGANGGETDNLAIIGETLGLRAERAALLGYADYASYRLETEMARTPEAVRDLLMQVWEPARAAANDDAAKLTAMMQADGINGDLAPWDWRYYSEKRRMAEHDLDEAALKPYFQLDKMIEAAFDCASRLFGLSFSPADVPAYHPDVRAWEVRRGDKLLAIFLGDYFARGSKRSGAWCSALRAQQKLVSGVVPIVINVCNFAKPSAGKPALLSYDDARTLFHEFGHALHQMLSDVTYPSISGTSVPRDFVELPSQLYEHWLSVPQVLNQFAVHAETGKPMPEDMRDRLLAAETYDMGFSTVEYLASALVDLAFHTSPPSDDPMAKQAQVLADLGMPDAITMRHATPQFAHVFSGDGYASAYYSYMWSEVMDADAFDAFTEAGGPFDAATAAKLERFILSTGASEEADQLYMKFRGKMPDAGPLLRGRGLAAE